METKLAPTVYQTWMQTTQKTTKIIIFPNDLTTVVSYTYSLKLTHQSFYQSFIQKPGGDFTTKIFSMYSVVSVVVAVICLLSAAKERHW